MLIDDVTITIHAGKGGDGAVAFRTREGNPKGGPDGGNGGNGGDVYFQGVDDLTALAHFQYKKVLKADDGVSGKRKNLFGKNADDLTIFVPIGTMIEDVETGNSYEIVDTNVRHLLALGGKGGRGNNEFKSATNQTPRTAEKGELGQTKILHLVLKLIANIGLIGLPNAGKSTLLSLLTSAKPKIGNYPFTTLEPNVGMMEGIMLADIPGLIEGASGGKGLGIKFLKHIEKTTLLVHCIDVSSPNPRQSYDTVRQEFKAFNPLLLSKPEIILLTKTDQVEESMVKKIVKDFKKISSEVFTLSVYDEQSVENFRHSLSQYYDKLSQN